MSGISSIITNPSDKLNLDMFFCENAFKNDLKIINFSMPALDITADCADIQLGHAENLWKKIPRLRDDIRLTYEYSIGSAKLFQRYHLWEKMLESLELANKCLIELHDEDNETECYVLMVKALIKLRYIDRAIDIYEKLANIHIDQNRRNVASEYYLKIANIYIYRLADCIEDLRDYYQKAETYYNEVLILSPKNNIMKDALKKLIKLYILMDRYEDCHLNLLKIFDYLRGSELNDYLLLAGLVYIINNIDNMEEIQTVLSSTPDKISATFPQSSQESFLQNVAKIVMEKNIESYDQITNDYLHVKSFELNRCILILRIKLLEGMEKSCSRRTSVDSHELFVAMQKSLREFDIKDDENTN